MLVTDALLRKKFGLTPREIEITHHLAEGETNNEIAGALNISPHTVKHHAEKIRMKLGVRSRGAIAALLIRSHRADHDAR